MTLMEATKTANAAAESAGKALTIRERMKTTQLPVIYEEACRALVACTTIDEAKYFADKSEALAAWAKIYKSDQAALEARRLKLHAYRRMGQLAAEIQPSRYAGFGGGRSPGPHMLLIQNGFSAPNAAAASKLGRMSKQEFDRVISVPRPQSPTTVAAANAVNASEGWRFFARHAMGLRSVIRQRDAATTARQLHIGEVASARALAKELIDWLDKFEHHLPKGKKK